MIMISILFFMIYSIFDFIFVYFSYLYIFHMCIFFICCGPLYYCTIRLTGDRLAACRFNTLKLLTYRRVTGLSQRLRRAWASQSGGLPKIAHSLETSSNSLSGSIFELAFRKHEASSNFSGAS